MFFILVVWANNLYLFVPTGIYLFKVNDYTVLMSLLLSFNRFLTLVWRFHC